MSVLLVIPCVLLLDRILGEPSYCHPLVGFGKLANWIESKLNRGSELIIRGFSAWFLAVIPITLLVYVLDQWLGRIWLSILCGWLAIGWKSLREHGLAVFTALSNNNIAEARLKTSYLVSRETSELKESDLSKATIESMLENGSDAIIAPLFYLAIFGAAGVVFYRLSNTLDAMWGYRNPRFEQFGKVTARIDDILNLIPARLTALLYLILGNSKKAWHAWRTQGSSWYSPNAGVVMATGAGALDLSLGGNAIYHGKEKDRPRLGDGEKAMRDDIKRSIILLDYSIYGIAVLTSITSIIYFLIHTYF